MTADDSETDSNTVVEVEFCIADPKYPLVGISQQTGCTAELQQLVPRSDGGYTVFYRTTGADPDRILNLANDCANLEADLISVNGDEGIFEVQITDANEFFVVTFTDAGAIPQQVWSADGVAHIVAEIPPQYSACKVIDHVVTTHPSMEVVANRQKDYAVPLFSRDNLQAALEDLLTARQREVLVAAYAGGYFEWPRRKSGEELAAEMGVAAPTFAQHLRAAERKLLSLLFTEQVEEVYPSAALRQQTAE